MNPEAPWLETNALNLMAAGGAASQKSDFSHVATACTAVRMPRIRSNDMKPRIHVALAK
jgi:hypothetical protein